MSHDASALEMPLRVTLAEEHIRQLRHDHNKLADVVDHHDDAIASNDKALAVLGTRIGVYAAVAAFIGGGFASAIGGVVVFFVTRT